MPMTKKEVQLIEPEIMYAAGRSVWVNISVVKMFVTPPRAQSTSLIKLVCANAHNNSVDRMQLVLKDY